MKSIHYAALIGAGKIGKLHAQNIHQHFENVRIKTVVEIAQNEALTHWANSLGIAHLETDYKQVLKDPEIDLVFICSATPTHTDIIKEATAHGKHIFCEKPVGSSISQALECQKSVQKSGLVFQIGFNRRFDHNFSMMQKRIQAAEIGEVRMLRITSRDPEFSPGEIFLDMSIHDFDMLRFLSSSEVAEIYVQGGNLINPEAPPHKECDSAILSIKLENNALAIIENIRETAYGYDQRAEVLGSEGMLQCTNDYPNTLTHFGKQGRTADQPFYFFLERYHQSYIEEVRSFIESIDNGTPPKVTIEDGIEPLFIAEAAKRSWETQTNIKLKDVKRDFI